MLFLRWLLSVFITCFISIIGTLFIFDNYFYNNVSDDILKQLDNKKDIQPVESKLTKSSFDISNVYDKTKNSVVKIEQTNTTSFGGFIIKSMNESYVVTNSDNINPYYDTYGYFHDNIKLKLKVSYIDHKNNIAFLSNDLLDLNDYQPLKLAFDFEVGNKIITTPFNNGTKTLLITGFLSGVETYATVNNKTYDELLITNLMEGIDLVGLPILNKNGDVIGMNLHQQNETNFSYVLPSYLIQESLNSVR